MMLYRRAAMVGFAVIAYFGFMVGAKNLASKPMPVDDIQGSVVLPPTLQTVLYLGDRYLAANIESMRVLSTGGDVSGAYSDYYHRLHLAVSLLNPCQEDNYYIANALLAWAGGVDPALNILRDATRCRFWDETPPFFLGYNLYFFKRDIRSAKEMLVEAAKRSPNNRLGYQQIAILMEAEGFPDPSRARQFLALQREQARDPKLRERLAKRIERLDGLIALNTAKIMFESRFGKALENPQDLLSKGILAAFPTDPTGLGYQFHEGVFSMREVKIRVAEPAK